MSESVFSIDLRPRRLSEVIGQDSLIKVIRSQIATARWPGTWMFAGPTGCGKTTLARIVAGSFQCEHASFGEVCDSCLALQDNGQFAIHEINASEAAGVDAMRVLLELVPSLPFPPTKRRVIILDEAQRLTSASQNLLLKPFEDSNNVVWIICTTEPAKIIPPLRGRCFRLDVGEFKIGAIKELLGLASKKVPAAKRLPLAPLGKALVSFFVSRPRDILYAYEKYLGGMKPENAAIASSEDIDSTAFIDVCRLALKGNWASVAGKLSSMGKFDGKALRLCICGYMRTVALGTGSIGGKKRAVGILTELTASNPPEELHSHAVVAALYRVLNQV